MILAPGGKLILENLPVGLDFVRPLVYTLDMQTMKMTDLLALAQFGDFGHCDWADMINNKAADPGFMRLVEDIERDGILTPILYVDSVVLNGHHRLAAAILLALDEVPVVASYDDDGRDDVHYKETFAYDNDGNYVSNVFEPREPLDLFVPDVVEW